MTSMNCRNNYRHILTSAVLALVALLSPLASSSAVLADIQVIVHIDNPINQLSKKQVIDLFMGRVASFPDKQMATPLDRAPGEPLRARFYLALTGKTEAQVDAYWATLVFAGRMSPPAQLNSQQEVIRSVQNNPAAIAYTEATQLPANIKVIMRLTATP